MADLKTGKSKCHGLYKLDKKRVISFVQVEYRSHSTNSNNPNFPIRDNRASKVKFRFFVYDKMNPNFIQARKLAAFKDKEMDLAREIHAFSPVGSDTFADESTDDEHDDNGDANVRYIVAPKTSEPRIVSANL